MGAPTHANHVHNNGPHFANVGIVVATRSSSSNQQGPPHAGTALFPHTPHNKSNLQQQQQQQVWRLYASKKDDDNSDSDSKSGSDDPKKKKQDEDDNDDDAEDLNKFDDEENDMWAKLEKMQKKDESAKKFDVSMMGISGAERGEQFSEGVLKELYGENIDDIKKKAQVASNIRARKKDEKLSQILGETDVEYEREDGEYESDYDRWGVPTKYKRNPIMRIAFAFKLGWFTGWEVFQEEFNPRALALLKLFWNMPVIGSALQASTIGLWNFYNESRDKNAKDRREAKLKFLKFLETFRLRIRHVIIDTPIAIKFYTKRKRSAFRQAHQLGVRPITWIDRVLQNVVLFVYLSFAPNCSILWTFALPLAYVLSFRTIQWRERHKYDFKDFSQRISSRQLCDIPGMGGKGFLRTPDNLVLVRLYPIKLEQLVMVLVLGTWAIWGNLEATGAISLFGEPFDSVFRFITQPWSSEAVRPFWDTRFVPGFNMQAPRDIFSTWVPGIM